MPRRLAAFKAERVACHGSHTCVLSRTGRLDCFGLGVQELAAEDVAGSMPCLAAPACRPRAAGGLVPTCDGRLPPAFERFFFLLLVHSPLQPSAR